MKNALLLIFLFLGVVFFTTCTKNDVSNEPDAPDGEVPADYPQLSGEILGYATFKANGKKYTIKDIDGFGWSESMQNWSLYLQNVSGSKVISIDVTDLKKGDYTHVNFPKNWLYIYPELMVVYSYYTTDPSCEFTITIKGNNGNEVWGDFNGVLKIPKTTDYLNVTEGKFSAKIE